MTEKEIIRNKEEAKKALDIIQSFCGYDKCKDCPFSDSDRECQFANNHPSTIKIREPEPESDSDWQEFEIDEDGYFEFNGQRYHYREDVRFEVENAEKFKGFGGWLYGDDDDWCMTPMFVIDDQLSLYCDKDKKATPATPTRIRFWRYRE